MKSVFSAFAAEEVLVPFVVAAVVGHHRLSGGGGGVQILGLFIQGDVQGDSLAGTDDGDGGLVPGLEPAQGAGEPEISISGEAYTALVQAMANARKSWGRMIVSLDREAYTRIMEQLQEE